MLSRFHVNEIFIKMYIKYETSTLNIIIGRFLESINTYIKILGDYT